MPFGLKEKLLQDILNTLAKYQEIEKAVIFGSRARGDFRDNSDIDIAIYTSEDIYIRAKLLYDLEELETLYRFDVVNVGTASNQELLQKIEEQGIEIFSRLIASGD